MVLIVFQAGDTADLICSYYLDSHNLYSVKWYKVKSHNFYPIIMLVFPLIVYCDMWYLLPSYLALFCCGLFLFATAVTQAIFLKGTLFCGQCQCNIKDVYISCRVPPWNWLEYHIQYASKILFPDINVETHSI